MRLINLTGAKNFIDTDGKKFVSVDTTNTLIDYKVSDAEARKLLPITNGNDVPYFSLVDSNEDEVVDEDATGADESESDESEDEANDEKVAPLKTTTKKVLKVGGKGKKAEKQVSV